MGQNGQVGALLLTASSCQTITVRTEYVYSAAIQPRVLRAGVDGIWYDLYASPDLEVGQVSE